MVPSQRSDPRDSRRRRCRRWNDGCCCGGGATTTMMMMMNPFVADDDGVACHVPLVASFDVLVGIEPWPIFLHW